MPIGNCSRNGGHPMHDEAFNWVAGVVAERRLDRSGVTVLDLGGRDVNGTTRRLFSNPARYIVVDIQEHPTVDVVADAAGLELGETFDVVTSTECLEHAERAAEIVGAAFRHTKSGGVFIATMAGPGRHPHGASGEPSPPPGEWYRNVEPDELRAWLGSAGFVAVTVDQLGGDVRCVGFRFDGTGD